MRLVHLSDLHLGFRAFPRVERGWNLRERDVAAAFRSAVREIIEVRPDLILITGDLFDRPDPPSTALLTLMRGFDGLRRALPDVPLLVIAGERDTPRAAADPGPVAALDLLPGVEAAAGAARAVRLRDRGVHALLVPSRAVREPPFPEVRPDPDARWNLLLIRGRPGGHGEGVRVEAGEWDYVAVGGDHLHGRREGEPVSWPGSLERIGIDPWREATEEKGFVVRDLEAGRTEFHPVPCRPVVDLAPVRTSPRDLGAGTRRLRDVLEGVPGGIDGKILRVRLRGDLLAPEEGAEAGLLAAVRARTAHVEFVLLGDDPEEAGPAVGGAVDGGARIIAVVGGEGPLLRAALEELSAREGPRSAGGPADPAAALSRLIRRGGSDPSRFLVEGVRRLRASRGAGRVGAEGPTPAEGRPAAGSGGEAMDLEALEDELARVRADAIEAAGEMEAGNLEWARSRQDAESRLAAYRERARELRARIRELEREGGDAPCPTCGRPVGEGLEPLLATLREEWEGLVQDGRWWKRRREQLDEKPEELRALEGRALGLQARVETLAEEVERERERLRWESRGAPAARGASGPAAGPPSASPSGSGTPEGPHPPSDEDARRLLREAGTLVHRASGGTLQGLAWTADGLGVRDGEGRPRPPDPHEVGVVRFALRLALWRLARDEDCAPGTLVVDELAGVVDPSWAAHGLALARSSLPAGATLYIALRAEGLAGAPEAVDRVVEVERGTGGPRLRESTGGVPRISFG